jgi:hypothetical protein
MTGIAANITNPDRNHRAPSFCQNQVNSGRHFGPQCCVVSDAQPLPTLEMRGFMKNRDCESAHRFSGVRHVRFQTK